MSITKADSKITFSYTYDELYEVAEMVTQDIAVTILDGENIPMTDEYGLSEDEVYTVRQKMYDGASLVFNKLLKIAKGITDSVTLDADGVSCIINDKSAYNANILQAIDRLIKQAIINYIIKDWFMDKKVADHAGIYNAKFVLNIQEIVKKSVQLRKSAIT